MFVRKIFYKAGTLPKVSLWCADHVQKILHFSHMGKPCFQALFDNHARAIQRKIIISNILLLYIIFYHFFMVISLCLRIMT